MTEMLESLEVDDIEVLEVLNNPMRLRILRQLVEPTSIREVAEHFDVPPTRLYYHFNMLEEAGIIRVVETRKVGAMLQKVYQTVARSFQPSAKLVESDRSPSELAKIGAGVILDGARLDTEEALTRHFEEIASGEKSDNSIEGALGRTIAYFTRERAEEFKEKLAGLLDEVFEPDDGDEGVEFAFSYAFFPIAGAGVGEWE